MPTTVERPSADVSKARPMTAKRAALIALSYFSELFNPTLAARASLEEIEVSDDGNFWLVTLGYDAPLQSDPTLTKLLPDLKSVTIRKYKVFKVDARSGSIVSMKMRQG